MKPIRITIFVAICCFAAANLPAQCKGHGKGQGQGKGHRHGQGHRTGETAEKAGCHGLIERLDALEPGVLSDAEREAIVHIREEEKLARDVYATLGEKWELRAFDNIGAAEQRHLDLAAKLLERYGVEDPIKDDTRGVFTDPKLGELHDSLVAKGKTSLLDALQVGATIEDLDLFDLEAMLAATDNADVKLVANNLAKGSRNHLRAFNKNLVKHGGTAYVAQHLSQERVDEIVNSEKERGVWIDGEASGGCGKMGRGGKGGGHGNCAKSGKAGCANRGQQGHGHKRGGGGGCGRNSG